MRILLTVLMAVVLSFQAVTFTVAAPFIVSDIQSPVIERRVSTLSDLKSTTGSTLIQAVQLMGGVTEGDGREGDFRWLSGDQSANPDVVADTEEGLFVKLTTPGDGSTGVWARQDVDAVNVRWFGAKIDGSDSAVAIQAAIDTGIPIENLNETFQCDADIFLKNSTKISGTGTLKFSGNFGVDANNADEFRLQGFRIHGSGGVTQVGLFIHNTCARWILDDVDIDFVQDAVFITNSWIGVIRDSLIGNSTVRGVVMTNGTGNCVKGTDYEPVQSISLAGTTEINSSSVCVQLGDVSLGVATDVHVASVTIGSDVTLEGVGSTAILCNNVRGITIGGYFEGVNKGVVLGGHFADTVVLSSCQFWGNGSNINPALEVVTTGYARGIKWRTNICNRITMGIVGNATLESLWIDGYSNPNGTFLSELDLDPITYIDYEYDHDYGKLTDIFNLPDITGVTYSLPAGLSFRTITMSDYAGSGQIRLTGFVGNKFTLINSSAFTVTVVTAGTYRDGSTSFPLVSGESMTALLTETGIWDIL